MSDMSDEEMQQERATATEAYFAEAYAKPFVLAANPLKLTAMFWPFYLLIALAVAVHSSAWWPLTPLTAAVIATPLLFLALGWLARGRWRLEFTPQALVLHTLGRTERFEWPRMGPVHVEWARLGHLPVAHVLRFAYPADDPRTLAEQVTSRFGRRLPPIFGDGSAKQQAAVIEAWRTISTARLVASGWSVPASALSLRR